MKTSLDSGRGGSPGRLLKIRLRDFEETGFGTLKKNED